MFVLLSSGVAAADYQTFEENGKVGIKDSQGTVILPPMFDALGWSDGSFSVVNDVTGYRQNGLWGIINLKKPVKSIPEFEALTHASGDYLVGRKKTDAIHVKSGCVNLNGEIKIPFVYDGISVHGLRAIVFNLSRAHYQFGLVDLENRTVIPVRYNNILPLGTLRYAVANEQNKIALFSEDGKAITDFSIDSISPFHKNFAIVYRHNLQGLVDREGMMKLETKYSSIQILTAERAKARLPSQWFFINEKNEIKKSIQAGELKMAGDFFLIRHGTLWGLLDKEWKEVISTQYEVLTPLPSGSFIAKENNKFGVINSRQTIVPFLYDSIKQAGQMLKYFTKGIGWQLGNAQGHILSERYYQQIDPATENSFAVRSRGYWGVLDSNGREIIHCVFDSLKENREGNWSVKFKNQYGVINIHEDWLVPPQDLSLQLVHADTYVQKQSENFLIKSFSGELIYFTPNKLKFEKDFFVEVFSNGLEKKINYNGQFVNEATPSGQADFYFNESEGFRGFKKDGHFGFVGSQGKLRIANRYDSIGEFHEGLAAMKLIGKWGFVDGEDHIAVNPNYDSASRFENGVAIVSRNGRKGMINPQGKIILPLRYDRVVKISPERFEIEVDTKKGLADIRGNVLIEPRYDHLQNAANGNKIVCNSKKWGTVSERGVNLLPMMYDQLVYDTTTQWMLAEIKSEWKEIELN